MSDLVTQAATDDFQSRAVKPARELGAYEALWMRQGMSFKNMAEMFAAQPGAIPSDFVSEAECEKYSRMALGEIRAAGIAHFGVRVNGAGEYPGKLRDAENPVELVYFQGKWDLTDSECVAIVGTRNPSEKGLRHAAQLAQSFVRADYTVVSGLAQGIDTSAHQAAIEAKGRTIAILGTPITSSYPAENKELQRLIANKYLLISQVPIIRHSRQGPKGNRLFFPERNVTMSVLTKATVIVEAGNTSGTLIQARHALAQHRKLFILEACFQNPELTWPARFVEQGAYRVKEFAQIMEHLAP